jgi:SulP family sulfate permease
MAVTIAFVGGRPAMISAATGAVALVVAPVACEYGVEYLFATVVLGGVLQVVLAAAGIARLMRFLPRSVMVGFVNALAILIFISQLPYLVGVPRPVYALLAAALVIMVGLPRLTRAVPAPLVSIAVLTLSRWPSGWRFRPWRSRSAARQPADARVARGAIHVGDAGHHRALRARLGCGRTHRVAHDAKLVDDITDRHSDKTRESWGQGAANIVTGFFGDMGGCVMIGQTMINVTVSGGRTRLSTFLAGAFLLILVIPLDGVVAKIPMAALAAVMVMVSVGTFDRHSIHPRTLRRMPKSDTAVMLSAVAVTVATSNLAYGVGVGVIVAMTLFARQVAHVVQANDPGNIVIDLSAATIRDASPVAALDAITTKYSSRGRTATITGINEPSRLRHAALAGNLTPAH